MANFPGRSGRRRRVLNEEVLSASASHLALRAEPVERATEARYSDDAAVENQSHVSDLIPRRHRSIALLVGAGLATTAVAGALQELVAPKLAAAGMTAGASLDLNSGSSFAAWIGSAVLLVSAATCVQIYSIRRHRIDDYRGRYRVWMWGALGCCLASLNCVVGAHAIIAEVISHFAAWSALRGGAIWWLALAGAPLVWIGVRTLLDVKECRLSAVLLVATTMAYATATMSFLGWLPGIDLALEPLLTGAAALLGHWLLLASAVSYARHVVLDSQGLIAVRASSRRATSSGAASKRKADAVEIPHIAEPSRPSTQPALRIADAGPSITRASVVPAKSQAKSSDWVDGTRREKDRYESDDDGEEEEGDGTRKFSKTERKQLRKLKARNRAA
jgi:hypothetical protein